jgi:hypothetical protein
VRVLSLELKDPQLQRATKLRADLRRTLAEVEALLRKAEELLRRNRRKPRDSDKADKADKGLFDGWDSPPRD